MGFLSHVEPSSGLTEMPGQPGLQVDVELWYQLRSLKFLLHLLSKSLNLSLPQFSHQLSGHNDSPCLVCVCGGECISFL